MLLLTSTRRITDLLELIMLMRRFFAILTLTTIAAAAVARSPVATFTKDDAARAFAAGCNAAPKGKIRFHRNPQGSMITFVAEKQAEAVFFAQDQRCNKVQDDVVDIWRRDDGQVAAQLIDRGDGLRLLIGEHVELRGQRFDVERTGQYLVISQGTVSTLSSVEKPYIKLGEVSLDAQRIFPRRGALLVVGDNTVSGQLEGRTVQITPGGLTTAPEPIQIAGMPAGVRILDYAEDTDDLLLAGIGESGQASFVMVNLTSGRSAPVQSLKPGDDMALFIKDELVRERLTGIRTPAQGGNTGGAARPTPQGQPSEKPKKRGWFGF